MSRVPAQAGLLRCLESEPLRETRNCWLRVPPCMQIMGRQPSTQLHLNWYRETGSHSPWHIDQWRRFLAGNRLQGRFRPNLKAGLPLVTLLPRELSFCWHFQLTTKIAIVAEGGRDLPLVVSE
jgi:hypothetical protein